MTKVFKALGDKIWLLFVIENSKATRGLCWPFDKILSHGSCRETFFEIHFQMPLKMSAADADMHEARVRLSALPTIEQPYDEVID